MTHMLKRNAENLSVPESQLESQVHSRSPNSDHQVSPNAQDSESGSLECENYEDSTPLEDRGSGSSLTQQTNVGPSLGRSEHGKIPRRYFQIEEEIFLCTPLEVDEPTSFQQAIDLPNSKEWMDAMRDEMDSMLRNQVWELADFPPGRKSIGNKWVFKIKRRADGMIDKFKARLVVKGFTQIKGVDYEETFSHVVRIASIRLLLALVAHLDLELIQMDVKTAFLNCNAPNS